MRRRILVGFLALPLTLGCSLFLVIARNIVVNRQVIFADSCMVSAHFLMKLTYALGVDVNLPGCTHRGCLPPLVYASFSGDEIAVDFLLENGADVNLRTNSGSSPLMVAAAKGNLAVVKKLVKAGADVNIVDKEAEGASALSLAEKWERCEVATFLRQAGAKK